MEEMKEIVFSSVTVCEEKSIQRLCIVIRVGMFQSHDVVPTLGQVVFGRNVTYRSR